MKKIFTSLFACLALNMVHAQSDVFLRFNQPATHFTEALPLGNGSLGAMLFGNPDSDKIVWNDISMWSGGVQDPNRKDAAKYLPEIQRLLQEGKNSAAQQLLEKHFVSAGVGTGHGNGKKTPFGCYQVFGEMHLRWKNGAEPYREYKRMLNMENAVATTTWERNKTRYVQEAWVSRPDSVFVMKLTASGKKALSFSITLTRKENAQVSSDGKGLLLQGNLTGVDNEPGIRFAGKLTVQTKGGKWFIQGDSLVVQNATQCVVFFTSATDLNWPLVQQKGKDPLLVVEKKLRDAERLGAGLLRKRHESDYSAQFQRCRLFLPALQEDSIAAMPTVERLKRYAASLPDPGLPALYFNYGRYLLISSSQPGGLPANLQGLWAEEYQTPWNGDYHLNINVQMNYWLANQTNLAPQHLPLFAFIRSLVEPGRATAKAYYQAPGWVAHVVANPWGFTAPGEGASWGSTLTGGAWLTAHVWNHFRFTNDTAFLKENYYVLKEAARFFTAILIRDPSTGKLVTAPSNSPENTYITSDGFQGNTCMGPTMDMQIGRELLGNAIRAAEILQTDPELRKEWALNSAQLAPNQISPATGAIQEWLEDYKEAEPQHRHISHLYGLYPYDEITPWATPELAEAARITLEKRGFAATGWSRGWKLNFWARLGKGDESLRILKGLLSPVSANDGYGLKNGAGTYPNLFCAHPPFQIDGNFGGTAGIAEMLLQSHGPSEVIRFLPALPADAGWVEGKVTGMKARGDFTVNFSWKKHRLTNAEITAGATGFCHVMLPKNMFVFDENGKKVSLTPLAGKPGCFSFPTKKGARFFISSTTAW